MRQHVEVWCSTHFPVAFTAWVVASTQLPLQWAHRSDGNLMHLFSVDVSLGLLFEAAARVCPALALWAGVGQRGTPTCWLCYMDALEGACEIGLAALCQFSCPGSSVSQLLFSRVRSRGA